MARNCLSNQITLEFNRDVRHKTLGLLPELTSEKTSWIRVTDEAGKALDFSVVSMNHSDITLRLLNTPTADTSLTVSIAANALEDAFENPVIAAAQSLLWKAATVSEEADNENELPGESDSKAVVSRPNSASEAKDFKCFPASSGSNFAFVSVVSSRCLSPD